ncbi:MAG: TonB family protein, partial [Gemmatimonadaceae bacterium]
PVRSSTGRPGGARRRAARRIALDVLLGVLLGALVGSGCSSDDRPAASAVTTQRGGPPDELPRMLNAELPFRYPPALYAQKAQANVLLRLFVDSLGVVVRDSTMVVEPSGSPQLDSAAVTGATELTFAPARRDGAAVGTMVLLPVHFRHPEAPPLPGDPGAAGAATRGTTDSTGGRPRP